MKHSALRAVLLKKSRFDTLKNLKSHTVGLLQLSEVIKNHDFMLYRDVLGPLTRGFGTIVSKEEDLDIDQRICIISDYDRQLEELITSKAVELFNQDFVINDENSLQAYGQQLLEYWLDERFKDSDFKDNILKRILICYAAVNEVIKGQNETTYFIINRLTRSQEEPSNDTTDDKEGNLARPGYTEKMLLILLMQERKLFPLFDPDSDKKGLHTFIATLLNADVDSIRKAHDRATNDFFRSTGGISEREAKSRIKTLNSIRSIVVPLNDQPLSDQVDLLIDRIKQRVIA